MFSFNLRKFGKKIVYIKLFAINATLHLSNNHKLKSDKLKHNAHKRMQAGLLIVMQIA